MNVLGYIVTKNKLSNILPFIKVIASYNLIEDKSKPILIVGLEEAKKYASSFSILKKKIGENLFWTFGKREKRSDYEKDIINFQDYVLKQSLIQVRYYYFNILTNGLEKVKTLLRIVQNTNVKTFYCSRKMIYMYNEQYVLGVSVDLLQYVGIKYQRIIDIIKKNDKNVIFVNDFDLDFKIKRITNEKKYIIPYFLSLQHN